MSYGDQLENGNISSATESNPEVIKYLEFQIDYMHTFHKQTGVWSASIFYSGMTHQRAHYDSYARMALECMLITDEDYHRLRMIQSRTWTKAMDAGWRPVNEAVTKGPE